MNRSDLRGILDFRFSILDFWNKTKFFLVDGENAAMAVESRISAEGGSASGGQNPKSKIRERILIIGHSNIGDAILMSGVIATVHQRYPEAHLTLVVGQRATALFIDDPRIHTLVDADRFDSAIGRLKLAAALWRYRPQLVVDLRRTFYPLLLKPLAAWRYFRQPPSTIRHMRQRHLWTLGAQVSELKQFVADQPLEGRARGKGQGAREPKPSSLADPGFSVPLAPRPPPPIWFSPKDVAHVEHLWNRWQFEESRPLIVICPGARSQIKQWTIDGFARVADRLIEANAQVLLAGEPAEEPIVEAILGLMTHRQRARSAVGLTTIRQLGVFMARAQLVIVNDSASLHLASTLDVPSITIFGPTDEVKYGPTSTHHRVVRRRLFCAPCEQALCAFNHECMRFVSAEEVVQAARELLQEQQEDATMRKASS